MLYSAVLIRKLTLEDVATSAAAAELLAPPKEGAERDAPRTAVLVLDDAGKLVPCFTLDPRVDGAGPGVMRLRAYGEQAVRWLDELAAVDGELQHAAQRAELDAADAAARERDRVERIESAERNEIVDEAKPRSTVTMTAPGPWIAQDPAEAPAGAALLDAPPGEARPRKAKRRR